jgi:CubicO group peptidase (beta-lactamase class C family)
MDSEILAKMLESIRQWKYDIHSVTVIRNGYLVVDAIIYPFDPDSMHNIYSCTKSINAALVGIAIEQGYIDRVQQSVLSFFPARTAANLDVDKENITLEHLLMMASGLECRDSMDYGWRGLYQMMQTDDWVQFMLDLPMAEPPGTRFEYCNGASFLLSAIIQETTGMQASDFAEKHLFGPLGIYDVAWPANPQGITIGYANLRMKTHDMAKIGYLYLNEGHWDGAQIVPADWVEASTRKHISVPSQDGYGYQWWIRSDGLYMARGYAGQYIFVVPEREMVVAITSNLDREGMQVPMTLLEDIISAARSSTPLPPNPYGVEFLESIIQQVAQNQAETEPVPPLPEIAQMVTGQTYILDTNPRDMQSVSLTFQGEAEALFRLTSSLDKTQVNPADPQEWWSDVEWPVGLDDVYRLSPGQYGIPMGMKGRWEDE